VAWRGAAGHRAGLRAAAAAGRRPALHASGAQTAFRFNSYVALALAERLAGQQGVAWIALLIVSLCVPLCNVAAVWPLARQGGHGYAARAGAQPADPGHRCRPGLQPAGPEAARPGADHAVTRIGARPCRWA
jgi:hypothetical protein